MEDPVVVTVRLREGEFNLWLPEQTCTAAECHRIHEQVQLVDKSVGEHGSHERSAAADVDPAVDPVFQIADRLRVRRVENVKRLLPERPLDQAGLREKFLLLTRHLNRAKMERLFERLQQIETEKTLDWLKV